jgi:hypothetical protein
MGILIMMPNFSATTTTATTSSWVNMFTRRRLKARRGPKKAVVAVAASIVTAAYHKFSDGTCYQDFGADYFARRDPRRVVAKLASRIRSLGYDVVVDVAEIAA